MRHAVVALVLAGVGQAQVPQWVQCPLNGHYYALSQVGDWLSAEQQAVSFGGHLATVRSSAENAWLVSTFGTGQECLWIGLNDQASEGSYEWSSGEPVSYLNWNPGEPNGGTVENSVHLCLPWGSGVELSTWNDAPSSTSAWGWTSRGIMEVSSMVAANYQTFGVGCQDPSGAIPVLAGVPGELPRIGTTSRIRVTNLPVGVVGVPIFVLGLSNQSDVGPGGSYLLPLDLGILGWPGCDQLVSINDLAYSITTTGEADHAIAVPPLAFLVGLSFYAQALVLYHPTGVAVSNGLVGTVGY